MGNCQAIDAAALVIQHPSGRIERLYWQISASEVMKMNPGHYVSLIIPLPVSEEENQEHTAKVRITRVNLLRPNDTLTLGHAYRLVTTQGMLLWLCLVGFGESVFVLIKSCKCLFLLVEVVKVLRAKKNAKMKKQQPESAEKSQTVPEKPSSGCEEEGNSDKEKTYQVSISKLLSSKFY